MTKAKFRQPRQPIRYYSIVYASMDSRIYLHILLRAIIKDFISCLLKRLPQIRYVIDKTIQNTGRCSAAISMLRINIIPICINIPATLLMGFLSMALPTL